MKFSYLYENLKLLDICKPVSPEEATQRDKDYPSIKIKEALDNVEKTKLSDGTWHVHGDLDLSSCNLASLKDLNVSIVDGNFSCSFNNLTSLEGCPKIVKNSVYCSSNILTSLEGCPIEVKGNFFCSDNNLISLEGCPKEVKGSFLYYSNKLTSLKGCPKIVKGSFYCYNNPKQFTKADIQSVCNVKGDIRV